MENNLLDIIYENYADCRIKSINYQPTTESVKMFMLKYIAPMMDKDLEEGKAMETLFSGALTEKGKNDFKNGFKLGVKLMKECFENFR